MRCNEGPWLELNQGRCYAYALTLQLRMPLLHSICFLNAIMKAIFNLVIIFWSIFFCFMKKKHEDDSASALMDFIATMTKDDGFNTL